MKFHAILLASILITSSLVLSNFDNAFAEHVEYKTIDEMEKIDVKVLFVNSFGECTKYQWDRLDSYSFVAKDYLWKYNIVANVLYKECINVDDEILTREESYLSNDLTIIIPDEVGTIERLSEKGYGGFYHVDDDPKTGELRGDRYIVTTSEAVDAESEWSVWVLSHELSHFALEWYGYPLEVWGGDGPPKSEVHLRDEAYYQCMSKDATGAMCPDLWELVESVVTPGEAYATGKKYHVMEPLRYERNSECNIYSCYAGKVVGYVGYPEYSVNGIKNSNSDFREGDEVCVKYRLHYALKDHSKAYPIPYEKVKVGKTILNALGDQLTNTEFKYYQVNDSGNFEFCEKSKMFSSSYWKNGYKYEVFFEGNSKYAANQGPILTLFFESNPNLNKVPVTPQQPTPVTPQQPTQPKQESTKVYPVSQSDLDSDDGVTYDSAHSKQVNQWAKFNKIQAKVTELRSIYDSQRNNPYAQQKLEKFESDLQILKDVLVVGDGFMDRGKYSKASTVYIRTIHGLNNLGFTELPSIESAVNGAMHNVESKSSYYQKKSDARTFTTEKIEILYREISKLDNSLRLQFDSNIAQKKIDEAKQIREMAMKKLAEAKKHQTDGYKYDNINQYKNAYDSFQKIYPITDDVERDLQWISKAITDAKKIEISELKCGAGTELVNGICQVIVESESFSPNSNGKTCFLFWCW